MDKIGEPLIKSYVNVKVSHRKFTPDPNGPDKGLNDNIPGRYGVWEDREIHNLLTDAGRDFLHLNGYETTGLGTNGGNYVALTDNSDAPADGDTTLASEITTGGLGRSQGGVAHTPGENTSTVSKTFTATAAHTAVQKSGLFTASTAGTLVHEAVFSSVNLQNNDQLAVTWTITLDD